MHYKSLILQQPYSSSTNNQLQTDILPYLHTLEKCTQILRDDRLWVRTQLKAGNKELLDVFKKPRKSQSLQYFQIRLRKYITGVKAKTKMKQLSKYKENLQDGHKKFNNNHRKQRDKPYKLQLYSFSSQKHHSSQLDYQRKRKQYFSIEKIKQELLTSPNPITHQKSKVLYSPSSQRIGQLIPNDNGRSKVSGEEAAFQLIEQIKREKNQNITQSFFSLEKMNGETQKETIKQKSLLCQKNEKSKQIQEYKEEFFNINFLKNKSINQNRNYLLPLNKEHIDNKQLDQDQKTNKLFESIVQYETEKNKKNDLFTSPELLMQCRKFLKFKSNSQLGKQYKEVFSEQFFKSEKEKEEFKPLKLEVQEKPLSLECLAGLAISSTLKDDLDHSEQRQQSFPVAIELSNEKKMPGQEKVCQANHSIQATVEEVINKIFTFCPYHEIPSESLIQFLYKQYKACLPFVNETIRQQKSISICHIGRMLSKYLPTEKENQVRQIYRLLDFTKKGVFTFEDAQQFLYQFKQAVTDFEQIQQCLSLLFQVMIPNKDDYDYWSLYSKKQSVQFKRLHQLLQQYEFQIEDQEF